MMTDKNLKEILCLLIFFASPKLVVVSVIPLTINTTWPTLYAKKSLIHIPLALR